MSIKCSERVWKHSRHGGSALLLLLAIARHAHDDGSGAWPSQRTLAEATRISDRQIRRLLRVLETSGELFVEKRRGFTDLMTVVVGADKMAGVPSEKPALDVRPPRTQLRPEGSDILAGTPDTAMSHEPLIRTVLNRPRTVSSEEVRVMRAPAIDGQRGTTFESRRESWRDQVAGLTAREPIEEAIPTRRVIPDT